MTGENLDILDLARRARELAEKATPGPWTVGANSDGTHASYMTPLHAPTWGALIEVVVYLDDERSLEGEANRDFIAFAREALPLLAEAVETLTMERDLAVAHDRRQELAAVELLCRAANARADQIEVDLREKLYAAERACVTADGMVAALKAERHAARERAEKEEGK